MFALTNTGCQIDAAPLTFRWVFGLSDPRPPALISGPRAPGPEKFSTSSTSSYLRFSHSDHGLWVYGLFKPCQLTHATRTCFKETALLLNVHLSCFVNFILCPTDIYIFKVNKLVFGNCSSSIYC